MWSDGHSHSGAITSANVWVHSDRTNIHEVDLHTSNSDRLEIIRDLAAYVRNPGNTVGYTYQEMKALSHVSAMATSSQDNTVILWLFALSSTSVHSSGSVFLHPIPCRRFSCSSVPRNAICYCTTYIPANHSNSKNNNLVYIHTYIHVHIHIYIHTYIHR